MEYLQYETIKINPLDVIYVLNLIINGIPSIPKELKKSFPNLKSFKPYYKWNTFNTSIDQLLVDENFRHKAVLNLIINGIPSIPTMKNYVQEKRILVF